MHVVHRFMIAVIKQWIVATNNRTIWGVETEHFGHVAVSLSHLTFEECGTALAS